MIADCRPSSRRGPSATSKSAGRSHYDSRTAALVGGRPCGSSPGVRPRTRVVARRSPAARGRAGPRLLAGGLLFMGGMRWSEVSALRWTHRVGATSPPAARRGVALQVPRLEAVGLPVSPTPWWRPATGEAARACEAQLGDETAAVREALRAFDELIGARDTGEVLAAVIADGPGWEGLGDLVVGSVESRLGGLQLFPPLHAARMLRTLTSRRSPAAEPFAGSGRRPAQRRLRRGRPASCGRTRDPGRNRWPSADSTGDAKRLA